MSKKSSALRVESSIDLTAILAEARHVYPIEKVGIDPALFSTINPKLIPGRDDKVRLADILSFYESKSNTSAVLTEKAKVLSIFVPHLNMSYLHWLLDSVGVNVDFEKFVVTHFQLIALSSSILRSLATSRNIQDKKFESAFLKPFLTSTQERLLQGFNTPESKSKWKNSFKTIFQETETLARDHKLWTVEESDALQETVFWQISEKLTSLLNPPAHPREVYVRLTAIADCFAEKMKLDEWF